jgi:hypothetical protein
MTFGGGYTHVSYTTHEKQLNMNETKWLGISSQYNSSAFQNPTLIKLKASCIPDDNFSRPV